MSGDVIIGSHDTTERVFIVAEIGINHNGSVETAFELIDAAAKAGADAVKFQVGNPERYVSKDQWEIPRETPWGVVPYIEYRKRMELLSGELYDCRARAERLGMEWFASPLDCDAVAILDGLGVPCYKVASPMVTDGELLDEIKRRGKPVILSSGMTTATELDLAVSRCDYGNLAILHATSEYPCPAEHTNLLMIPCLQKLYPGRPIGYSGHETGIPQSIAAVALGARIVERHLTLSRATWGSDHAASLEPEGFRRMVGYIRTVEQSLGDGVKTVYEGERANMRKFRKLDRLVGTA